MSETTSRQESDSQYLNNALENARKNLLDTSRRNRLLRFKESARDIAIIDEMPDQVYDHLVLNCNEFYFDHFEKDDKTLSEEELLLKAENAEPNRTLPKSTDINGIVEKRYRDNHLQTPLSEKNLERCLRKLYLDHKLIIEETGANCLYLATGFLKWFDREDTKIAYNSPLILIPVRLEKIKSHGVAKYKIYFDDEAIDTNFSLYEKLKYNFDITLPLLKEEQAPESYWTEVEEAVNASNNGWSLAREMVLGLFRFNKQIMWHDLDPTRWPAHSQLIDKPVLKRILIGSKAGDSLPGLLTHEYPQDNLNHKNSTPQLKLIKDADSSQYDALVDALTREDGLVIEGPPGTGKSQTITNIIASALDRGHSVLFVAEKMAALKVVSDRLTDCGLDDFCLQLHGLKTRKVDLLVSVMHRLNRQVDSPHNLSRRKQELEQAKEELIGLSHALTETVGPEELELHQVIWRVECLQKDLPKGFMPITIGNPEKANFEQFSQTKTLLNDLASEWSAIPHEAREAWKGFVPNKNDDQNVVESQIEKVISAIGLMKKWLNENKTTNAGDTLFEVHRLINLSELHIDKDLPPFPINGDLSLAHRIFHGDMVESFRELLEMLDRYLAEVKLAAVAFDYASTNAHSYAEKLRTNAKCLANNICCIEQKICELPHEKQLLDKVISNLVSLAENAAPVTQLTDKIARTLDDYKKISESAVELSKGPKTLSRFANKCHIKASVMNYFDESFALYQELNQNEKQFYRFYTKRVEDTKSFKDAYQYINKTKDKWFVIFDKQYRSAKKLVKNILREPKDFSRKKVEFLEELRTLVEFFEKCDQFNSNEDFQMLLGALFIGMETNWEDLKSIIEFSQKLRERLGMDNAQAILSDWNTHVDNMMNVYNDLSKKCKNIEAYAQSHPLPKTVWQRPINEIINTLKPLSEKLEIAVEEIVQPWCNADISLEQVLSTVASYKNAREQESRIQRHSHFDQLLGAHWDHSLTNDSKLKIINDWITALLELKGVNFELLCWIVPEPDVLRWEDFVALLKETKVFSRTVTDQVAEFEKLGAIVLMKWIGGQNNVLGAFESKLNSCLDTITSIPLMVRWQMLNEEVHAKGMASLSEAVISGVIVGNACSKVFEYSLYKKILENKISENQVLRTFSRTHFERLQSSFAALDKEIQQLNAEHIAARLCKVNIPEGEGYGSVKNYTEKRLLTHEAKKKKRHIPIRQLIKRAGNALQALKPCFLMSPLSVAQYLEPGKIEFDLVIMDESSQIRPEDALGSIARARKAVIVGDPKQLPPTNFFATSIAEDEETEDSILCDTESMGMFN